MPYHTGGGALSQLGFIMQQYGITDAILPFLLIFTIIFAVLNRIKLFGENKKAIDTMIALLISILTVVPHLTGDYPVNYDPIRIINTLVPSAAVLGVVIILILFLMGMFGKEFIGGGAPNWIAIPILLVLLYIFGGTVGWWTTPDQTFGSWFGDIASLVVIILVFGLILWFITSEPTKTRGENMVEKLGRWFFR